jgi:3-hydroxymyristoyl/3-hydroxydecanoyl-(acyl carrier protein) dehydratase
MRLLPEILAERAATGCVELELRVPVDLACFAGHFPGLAILPGVVQIDWSVRLARARLPLRGKFAAMEHLKFLSIVRPEARLTLQLQLASPERLAFCYSDAGVKRSSGVLVFAAQ